MNNPRRKFLTSAGALTASAMAGSLGTWGVESANAAVGSGYQAIVCVFLFGGNDSNNMIVPYSDYAAYSAVRTTASQVGIPQANLIQFSAAGKTYGFHPSMSPLASVYAAGKMAVLANAGTLVAPIANKAAYQANPSLRPPNLFSHADQQDQWSGTLNNAPMRSGWGGRMSDLLVSANAGALIPSSVSVAGSQVFASGVTTAPLVIPQNGGVTVSGQGTDATSIARFNALTALLANATPGNAVVQGSAGIMSKALAANSTANPILTATLPAIIQTAFTVNGTLLNTGIAQQLRQVARLIDRSAETGVKRQFFLVGMGGYDTHVGTVTNQTNLFNQLFPAMRAFYDYTAAAGISNSVVQITMSDFNRTFIGNANQGVDHAWGGHHLVIGGAVKGGEMYGTFPDLITNGTMDSGSNGAWIPGIAVDQIGATLGRWLGMPGSDIAQVFPNLANFTAKDLQFV
ncbi:MAG: DUF1501 domain-containing protein [Burkholderiales bacterium]